MANSARLERAQLVASEMASVSTSQVCRVGPAFSAVTYYKMDISFQRSHNKWTIAKRYSEFYQLRRTLKVLLQRELKRRTSDKALLPLKLLNDALAKAFPRRHLRGDNDAIITERRGALEGFVQLLVKIMCSFPPDYDRDTGAGSLKELHKLLKTFLAFPEEQLHLDAKRTLAILALEDVVVATTSNEVNAVDETAYDCCSICLGDWHEAECADMHTVKLPCGHVFHEECVLDWLNGSAECPLCRSEPLAPR
ncbi:hypothetical protein ACHHYP_06855 [Achlya hypogyna]|uniref:RING-type domain-containing protein n=1 Tax=Achlya hypogyna TaxID=1202772 RepID=A0A1V9YRM4_ACHHY|nr:hypothetical protein ACHHYP_06855 [Achlya hypogyna]